MAVPEIIGGYRRIRHLWNGQDSQIWEVVEPSSGIHFAMKILLPGRVAEPEARRRLFHEAEIGRRFKHPNIIKIVSISRDELYPHFVMEFFPAGSLKVRIVHFEKEREFLREKGLDILKQAATALAFMNTQGYVHRDVKPDNILVNGMGEVRLIDFAIAMKIPTGLRRWLHFLWRTQGAGTQSYVSPEQLRGEAVDARTDIYSFGATAYEMAAGRPPFRGATSEDLLKKHIGETPVSPCVHNPDVTREFGEFTIRLLAKKREDRPANFHEVLMLMRNLRVFRTPVAKSDRDD